MSGNKILLSELIKSVPHDTEERVKRAKDRYNNSIRDAMRRETGLLLNRRDAKAESTKSSDNINVPIRILPGLPAELDNFSFDDEKWLAVTLTPYRESLKKSNEGLSGIVDLVIRLQHDQRGQLALSGRDASLPAARSLIADLLTAVDSFDPVKQVLSVNRDVLGVYRYRLPLKPTLESPDPFSGEIELYWAVIGWIAGMLGVSADALTAVVLAHEVAHAYTHLGSDIDGERWGSTGFASSDHALKEGLAQYYTFMLVNNLRSSAYDVDRAYEELLKRQPDAYKTHVAWTKENRPEEVRFAMLEVRRYGKGLLNDFNLALTNAKQRLSH